jgi:thiamine-phosphate pyrophosphorylase
VNRPFIYLITKGEATSENFAERKREILEIVSQAITSGITHIQIREKHLSARMLFELAEAAAKITSNSETRLLINDRADIALAAGADGVHLPANSLSPQTVRAAFPNDFLIGVSTHSFEAAENAKMQGADFVTYGPVFASPNKGAPKGLSELASVCDHLAGFPVIGLGGIDETSFQDVLNAGAAGFAAIRFLNDKIAGK